jgi:hypothetical protein
MPGYNHYSWCMCGWCYKTGSNGYGSRKQPDGLDYQSAKATIVQSGADRTYTACFVVPNAICRFCGRTVFYYENEHGSKVFFDELGWPWPKHSCPGNPYNSGEPSSKVPRARTLEGVLEVARAAREVELDPASKFRSAFGEPPWDLLSIDMVIRRGFENFIKARSLSPWLDEAVFIAFISAKVAPMIGDYLGFNGEEVSILDTTSLQPKRLKARLIKSAEFPLPKGDAA